MNRVLEDTISGPAASVTAETFTPPARGLLDAEAVTHVLQVTLGDFVSKERLRAAAEALQAAVDDQWEQLPPSIHPEVGFNFPFLVCINTCWLGRQILVQERTFRIFRLRQHSDDPAEM